MKKLPYITAAGTILLLYIFSLAPSVEEKITWGGIYPPPTPEFSWKKKWQVSKEPNMFQQDAINCMNHLDYCIDTIERKYKGNVREPVIKLDKSPYRKIRRFQRYLNQKDTTGFPRTERRISWPRLDTKGETLDELIQKYSNDKMVYHGVDTLRYGYSLQYGCIDPELGYMLSRIHYAEMHIVSWIVRKNSDIRRTLYFINDNGTLRSFWGHQLGKGLRLPDNIFDGF